MDKQILFYEKQYFKQWWLYALLLSLNGMFIYACITQVGMGLIFGDKPMSNTGLIVTTIAFIAFTVVFLRQHLATEIDAEGIHIKFWPYHRKWRFYAWGDIASCEVKQYKPLSEYGGWGLRFGAYNVSGNKGMLIRFKLYDNLLIGTQKPEELNEVIAKLNKNHKNE